MVCDFKEGRKGSRKEMKIWVGLVEVDNGGGGGYVLEDHESYICFEGV